jgi:hypothetical protein
VSRRLPVLPALAAIVLALTVAAIAFAAWQPATNEHGPRLELAGQTLKLSQTKANQALIKLGNAKPGQIATGSARLTVTGAPALMTVGIRSLRDVPGRNGGKLRIAVSCTGHPCPGTGVAYIGPVNQMGTRTLGRWPAGTSRTYTVRVWMQRSGVPPSNTTGDNLFKRSRAEFGLLWRATQP